MTTNGKGAAGGASAARQKGAKARLLSLSDIDRRTTAYRRTQSLIESIEGDLGGSDRLSTGERQLVQHAAVHGALLEDLAARWLAGDEIDPALYATLSNAQRRLFETLGVERQPRDVTPSLQAYVAERYGGGTPQQPGQHRRGERRHARRGAA